MTDIRIELNNAGIREILNSESVQAALTAQAREITARIPNRGEYAVTVEKGKTRARARISTTSESGYWSERKHNYLLKASGAGVKK